MSDKITLVHEYIGKTLDEAGLVGVNTGPLVNKSGDGSNNTNSELSSEYRQDYTDLGVNSVRTHDFYSRFDLDEVYDIENGTYDWEATDEAFKYIVSSGAYVYLRLGFSFVSKSGKFTFMNSSGTQNTMCKVALAVVDRYKSAEFVQTRMRSKFENKIKYIEIWNEPDHSNFWPEDKSYVDDFVDLFYDILTSIRSNHPELKIGGPGFTQNGYSDSKGKKIINAMIDKYEAKKSSRALDFLSWHCYSTDPDTYQTLLEKFSTKVAHKLGTKIHHITEWNRSVDENEDVPTITQFEISALSACWMWMNRKGIHEAHFFRGIDGKKGVVNEQNHTDQPIAYAFKLWSRFAQVTKGGYNLYKITGEKSETTISWDVNENDRFFGIGAYGKNCFVMLLTNVSKKEDKIEGDEYKYAVSTPKSSDDFDFRNVTVYKVTQGGVSKTDSDLNNKWVLLKRNAVHLIVVDL